MYLDFLNFNYSRIETHIWTFMYLVFRCLPQKPISNCYHQRGNINIEY